MLLIEGDEGKATRYNAVSPTGGARFTGVRSRGGMTAVEIAYRNNGGAPELAELRINSQTPTVVAFPATADHIAGKVTIEARLDDSDNVLTFSAVNAAGRMPLIDSINVLSP
jgi:hypothetical protein